MLHTLLVVKNSRLRSIRFARLSLLDGLGVHALGSWLLTSRCCSVRAVLH
jgi:hypothetical protein